jgi:hypothetical protein
MSRFDANRWLALVLILGLVLGSAVVAHAGGHGVASGAYLTGGDGSDPGGSSPPPIGDPDSPTLGTKGPFGNGKPAGPVLIPGSPVGDGSVLGRVWTMRLGALLQITRIRFFGI